MIEATLQTYVASASAVSAEIGARIYPQTIPQRGNDTTKVTRPLIVYQSNGFKPDYHMKGVNEDGKATMEFECQAETYFAAKSLAAAVLDRLHKLTALCPCQLPGHWIESCFAETQPDDHTPGISGQETGFHSVTVQTEITFI